MRPYKGSVVGKVIVGGIETKVGISNGGTRHVNAVDNLLEERGRAVVRVDVVNGGNGMGEEKQNALPI